MTPKNMNNFSIFGSILGASAISLITAIASVTLMSSIAFAAEPDSSDSFMKNFEIGTGVELPVQIGIKAKVNVKNNFYASFGVGYAAAFLSPISTGVASNFGTITAEDGEYIDDTLSNSIYLDFRVGYNIKSKKGFFVEGGYSLLTGGGGETSRAVIENVTQKLYNFNVNTKIETSALVHSISIFGGHYWDFTMFKKKWILSVTGGIVKPISATTDLTFSSFNIDNQIAEDDIDDIIPKVFSSDYMILTAGVWFSYAFK